MKHPRTTQTLFFFTAFLLPVIATAETAVESQIVEVTVYADRAQVTREASIDGGAATASYDFAALPGWIDEASVRVALSPRGEQGAGRIVDVETRRTFLAQASDGEVRQAEAALVEIADQIAVLNDELAVLEAEGRFVDEIRLFSLDKLPRDVAVREVTAGELTAAVDFLGGNLRRLAAKRRQIGQERRALEPEHAARKRRLEEVRQRAQLEERSVVVTVDGVGAATLSLTYMLPGATWLPVHEVRSRRDEPAVALASYAEVRQTTGEDWSGARLMLATQRSTETLRIPEVEALLLGGGSSVARLMSGQGESFAAATRSWTQQNAAYFAAHNDVSSLDSYRSNQALQVDNARRVTEVFRTLASRGTTAHFAATGAQTVRSDGRRVRVPIGQADLQAQRHTLAAPELSLNAVRTVDLVNGAAQPLLPGKVSLYVDGAFLGLTEVGFVAPGEAFSLFLGVHDSIKLSRKLDAKRSELNRRGTKTLMSVSFVLRVENLSGDPQSIELRDRVPVSQVETIRVLDVKITPSGTPDAKGLLAWNLDLAPRTVREFRIEYTIEYPSSLVVRLPEESRDMNRTIDSSSEIQRMRQEAGDLERELKALEKNFKQ